MSAPRIAARYAEALVGLAQERRVVAEVRRELEGLAELVVESAPLRELLECPDLAASAKLEVLRESLGGGFSDTVMALLDALVRHGRGDALPQVSRAFGELADQIGGVVRAEAHTAVSLTDDQRQRLIAAIERITGKNVALEERSDPSVLAGVRLRVGDKLLDGSAAGRLERLRQHLIGQRGREQ